MEVFMNYWTNLSIEFANQKNYLDELFKVYPTIPNCIRCMDENLWGSIEKHFNNRNNYELVDALLNCELFPIKDSYIAYLRKDHSALDRNPQTINRIAGALYDMGLNKIYEKCCEPKETNRQIGPLFKRWIASGALGIIPVPLKEFISSNNNAILNASDFEMLNWAKNNINYTKNKGLDFVARFNGKYIIGEAKFLTDFGGHQNAQLEDAISTINTPKVKAKTIAILDGVLYIRGNNKMHTKLLQESKKHDIMSALLLRDYLYSV